MEIEADSDKVMPKRDASDADLSPKGETAKSNKMETDTTVKGAICGLRTILQKDVETISQKMGEIYVSQSENIDAVQFQSGFIETVSTKLIDMERRERERDRKIDDLSDELKATKEELTKVKIDVSDNKKVLRSNNMIINGFQEKTGEKCIEASVEFLKKLVPELCANHISTAYRIGKKGNDEEVNRAMFIKFKEPEMKTKIMQQKGKMYRDRSLGMRNVFCNDDLSEERRILRQEMREIAKFAIGNGYPDAKVVGEKLVINGITYLEDELELLPKALKMESIRTRAVGPGLGFYSKYSFLSNFYPAKLVINGQRFISSEQAYQYNKALMCHRDDIAKAVKGCTDPKKIKRFGDKAETTPEWENKKCEIMKCILIGKFSQNKELKDKLLRTGSLPLLECTTNLYWGTGWKFESEGWSKRTAYPGRNKLGELLGEVRELLESPCYPPELFDDLQSIRGSASKITKEVPDLTPAEDVGKVTSKEKESGPGQEKDLATGTALPALPVLNDNGENSEMNPSITTSGIPPLAASSETSLNSSDIMDAEEADATSLSFDSEVNRSSFNAKSIIKGDGHLDHEKMMGWSLPTIDMSNLRKLANNSFPEVARLHGGDRKRKGNTMLAHSTPVVHVTNRKPKKVKKSENPSQSVLREKENLIQMLNKFKNNDI